MREAAAMKGAAEIGSTVLSMSVSLVAVFIPILLMGGIIGRLFREFAVVLSVAILVSLVVSLTTTPMMCSVLLRKKAIHGKWYMASERAFERILKGYEKSLGWVLDHSLLLLIVAIATLGLNVYLYIEIPKGIFPAAGYRAAERQHHRRSVDFLSGDAEKDRAAGGDRQDRIRASTPCWFSPAAAAARRPIPAACSSRSSRSHSARRRPIRSSIGCARNSPWCRARRCICKRCRTSE